MNETIKEHEDPSGVLSRTTTQSSQGEAARPRCISTRNAPPPFGDAYCQGVVANGQVYVSGQGGLTPDGRLLSGAQAQARQAIANVRAILLAAGSDLRNVTRTTLYFSDLRRDGAAIGRIYVAAFAFPDGYRPARMSLEVAKPPLPDSLIWIDAVAIVKSQNEVQPMTDPGKQGETR